MIAADYLKLPPGIGGFKEALIMVNYMMRWTWGFMLKKDGSSTTTAKSLEYTCTCYAPPKALFTDNGPHFQGEELRAVCEDFNIDQTTSPTYSPHCNGLVENENKLLMRTLAKMCNPGPLPMAEPSITHLWPQFFNKALNILNGCVTPVLGTSLRAILFGTIDGSTDIDDLIALDPEIGLHMELTDAQRDKVANHTTIHQAL